MNELNTKDLKEYLFHVRDLEASCYEQREYIKSLETLYKQEAPALSALLPARSVSSIPTFSCGCGCCTAVIGIIIGIIVSINKSCQISIFNHDFSSIAGFFVIVLLSFVISIIVGSFLGILWGIYEKSNDVAENQKIEKQNADISESNQKATEESDTRAKMISKEIAKAKHTLTETSVLLNDYYSSGVVYPKYQGLIPVTMFCEYLASGRCDTLTGHEGAYNIYENEIRLNLIIVKLEEVVDKLDQIAENQYMLASMLEQNNRELQSLKSAVATQTAALERIEDNTEVSNYYNRITAANTDFLTWAKTYEIIRSK